MSLRRRLVLLAAGTVGATLLLASISFYAATRASLRGQVDELLTEEAGQITDRLGRAGPRVWHRRPLPGALRPPPVRPGEGVGLVQLVGGEGAVVQTEPGQVRLPVGEEDLAVARGERDLVLYDREVGGEHLRVLTARLGPGGDAVQLARSLEAADATLARLRNVLAALWLAGTGVALLATRLLARKVVQPVTELTEAAEHISATEDLGRRVDVAGDDEVGRMAQRFNAMLDRLQASREELAASVAAQRQLVADASHELRTPVTSLRTNVEVLLEGGETDRRALLDDVRAQTEELGALINDVIELARGDRPVGDEVEDVRLDEVVAEAVDRARRHAPGLRFRVRAEPTVLAGAGDRLGRAVANLLANAASHSPAGGAVEVTLEGGVLEVRDHGPGVPDADKPHVFDRFYRGATARGRPGSGLGLAIVRQAAEAHGGAVEVADAPGGGALFRIVLPAARPVQPAYETTTR